jgi:hypothetical protein
MAVNVSRVSKDLHFMISAWLKRRLMAQSVTSAQQRRG